MASGLSVGGLGLDRDTSWRLFFYQVDLLLQVVDLEPTYLIELLLVFLGLSKKDGLHVGAQLHPANRSVEKRGSKTRPT